MRGTLSLVALAGIAALVLFGCGSGGYDTTTSFQGAEVNVGGTYTVMTKDPGILPGVYSLQLFQTGKSLEAIDNLGRTWTGTLSNLGTWWVTPTGQQQDQTQQQQQQQQPEDESYHGDVYLTTQTPAGQIVFSGSMEINVEVATTTGGQTTSDMRTGITGIVVDERGNSGYVQLVSLLTQPTTTQQP